MKPLVAIVKVEGSVEDAVREAVGLLGGIGEFVKPGDPTSSNPIFSRR